MGNFADWSSKQKESGAPSDKSRSANADKKSKR